MYTPIHVHSMYSIRDSIIKLEDLAKRCCDQKFLDYCDPKTIKVKILELELID